MSERVTLLGTEFVFTTSNKARVTLLGTEYVYKELVQSHGLSNYLKDALVNHLFRSATFVKPTQLWVALYSLPPSAAGGGTEASGNGYARAQLNPGETNWNPPTSGSGETSNGVDIVFPTPTGGGWGTLTAWGLFDAKTGGNFLAWSTFSSGIPVAGGSNPRFVGGTPGDLTITLA